MCVCVVVCEAVLALFFQLQWSKNKWKKLKEQQIQKQTSNHLPTFYIRRQVKGLSALFSLIKQV